MLSEIPSKETSHVESDSALLSKSFLKASIFTRLVTLSAISISVPKDIYHFLVRKLQEKISMPNNQYHPHAAQQLKRDPLLHEDDNTYIWKTSYDLERKAFPEERLLRSGKWLCLEYQKTSEKSMLRWIEELNDYAVSKHISFLRIVVFVDYNALKSYEVARLKRHLTPAGAFISEFSKVNETLMAAAINYNRSMAELNLRMQEDSEKRFEVQI